MPEHLSLERISALLDEPAEDRAGADHLEGCPACRAEFERMSRMRMALSAMSEAEPPAGEWSRITARLELGGRPASGGGGTTGLFGSGIFMGWPLRAAAAVLLFAGGIMAGVQLTGGVSGSGDHLAAGSDGESGPPTVTSRFDERGAAAYGAEYLAALSELQEMGAPRWAANETFGAGSREDVDPAAAAERLARLDALIRASRQSLEEDPADPMANGLLFHLVDERNALASRLRESLHLTSLEYR